MMINPYIYAMTASDPTNWALSSNGSTATATGSSGWSSPAGVINGLRHTNNQWGVNSAAGWESAATATVGSPQVIEIDFGASRLISEINIYTIADAVNYTSDPTLADTFSSYGIENYTADLWNGSWNNTATVTGNNKVWRQFLITPFLSSKFRLSITKGKDNATARVVEIELIGTA